MPRILAIDYGMKRSGVAVTDPLKIIATGLTTVETPKLVKFVKEYTSNEPVELIIVGESKNLDDTDNPITVLINKFIDVITRDIPAIPVLKVDEQYTSKRAKEAMIEMGMKKMQRRNKSVVDQIAATIILQQYLEQEH